MIVKFVLLIASINYLSHRKKKRTEKNRKETKRKEKKGRERKRIDLESTKIAALY